MKNYTYHFTEMTTVRYESYYHLSELNEYVMRNVSNKNTYKICDHLKSIMNDQ